LNKANIESTTEAPITATELETDPAAPASGPGAGAGERSWAVVAAKKSAATRAATKELTENAMTRKSVERKRREKKKCCEVLCEEREKRGLFIVFWKGVWVPRTRGTGGWWGRCVVETNGSELWEVWFGFDVWNFSNSL